jgi:hypothetical protein
MHHERWGQANERSHLPGLRATDDFPALNQASLRRERKRVPMQTVRVFNDRACELDHPAAACSSGPHRRAVSSQAAPSKPAERPRPRGPLPQQQARR